MLKLSLSALEHEPVRIREQVPPDSALLSGSGIEFSKPLQVDLEASSVGNAVLVRGDLAVELERACRRCLKPVSVLVSDSVNFLYDDLSPEEAAELEGEVYALPDRGDELDLSEAIREQLIVRMPRYVVCTDECRGLCPICGGNLNEVECDCTPDTSGNPWDALKNLTFD